MPWHLAMISKFIDSNARTFRSAIRLKLILYVLFLQELDSFWWFYHTHECSIGAEKICRTGLCLMVAAKNQVKMKS